jgi:hypothetical protein
LGKTCDASPISIDDEDDDPPSVEERTKLAGGNCGVHMGDASLGIPSKKFGPLAASPDDMLVNDVFVGCALLSWGRQQVQQAALLLTFDPNPCIISSGWMECVQDTGFETDT